MVLLNGLDLGAKVDRSKCEVGYTGGDVAPLDILDGDVLEVEANFFSRHSLG